MEQLQVFAVSASIIILISGCTSIQATSDPSRDKLEGSTVPSVLSDCAAKARNNSNNAVLAICVFSAALTESNYSLCDYSPNYYARSPQTALRETGQPIPEFSPDLCKSVLNRADYMGSFPGGYDAWYPFYLRNEQEVTRSIERMSARRFNFNTTAYGRTILAAAIEQRGIHSADVSKQQRQSIDSIINLLLDSGSDPKPSFFYFVVAECEPMTSVPPNLDLTRRMLEEGSDANANGKFFGRNNVSVLQVASDCYDEGLAELLLSYGARDVNASLFVAVGRLRLVQLLVEHGADVNAIREDGCPVAYSASGSVLEYLLGNGADPQKACTYSNGYTGTVFRWAASDVLLRLKYGANPNVTDSDGDPALFDAMWAYNDWYDGPKTNVLEKINYMILYGADVNARSRQNVTPLMYAAALIDDGHYKDAALIKLLLKNGADVSAVDYKGKSAIDYATGSQYSPGSKVKQLLLDWRDCIYISDQIAQQECKNRILSS